MAEPGRAEGSGRSEDDPCATLRRLLGVFARGDARRAAAALLELIRRPRAEWLLLFGLAILMGGAMVFMTLKLPYLALTKAFYGMPAFLALFAFGAWGLDILSMRRRAIRTVVTIAVGTWAVNTLGSFWIPPRSAEARTALGWSVIRQDPEKSPTHFRSALRIDPHAANALLGAGEALRALGRDREAAIHYDAALKRHPNDVECHIGFASLLVRQRRTSEAETHLHRAIALSPDHVKLYPALGELRAVQGRLAEAVAALRDALRVDPFDAQTHFRQGVLSAQLQDEGQAIRHYTYALRVEPSLAEAHYRLAVLLARRGDIDHAMERYRAALRLRPKWWLPANNLAWILATQPEARYRGGHEAIDLARRACQATQHQEPQALDTLAAAFAEAGQFNEAVATAQRAIDLASQSGQEELASQIAERLAIYRDGRPYRDR
ncbi:MAG: tetratricopeptide repeat protein [Pirellulales bacterium]